MLAYGYYFVVVVGFVIVAAVCGRCPVGGRLYWCWRSRQESSVLSDVCLRDHYWCEQYWRHSSTPGVLATPAGGAHSPGGGSVEKIADVDIAAAGRKGQTLFEAAEGTASVESMAQQH